ncbi:unnamed protein product [Parnassius apollo]|uniref:(apollo) hypothetical protein n=1 Tax=Parnassius apollo TaxID=110799 RepID=A0A8S3X7S3_PARAO|nr:unnamed protein product [Parnassius apollo]
MLIDADKEDTRDGDLTVIGRHIKIPSRTPAEITYGDTFSDRDDSENDLSLSVLAKRIRNANECLPEDLDQQISSTSCSTPSISCSTRNVTLSVSKTQRNTWRNRHNPSEFTQLQDREGPKNQQSPLYYYKCMVNDEVIEIFVHYSNLYASQRNVIANITTSEMKCFWVYFYTAVMSWYCAVKKRQKPSEELKRAQIRKKLAMAAYFEAKTEVVKLEKIKLQLEAEELNK